MTALEYLKTTVTCHSVSIFDCATGNEIMHKQDDVSIQCIIDPKIKVESVAILVEPDCDEAYLQMYVHLT